MRDVSHKEVLEAAHNRGGFNLVLRMTADLDRWCSEGHLIKLDKDGTTFYRITPKGIQKATGAKCVEIRRGKRPQRCE